MHFLDLGVEDEFNNSDRSFSFEKGVDDMRRFMILSFLVLFLSSVGLFSCGSVSETPISQSDIPSLIGKWEGRYVDAAGWPDLVTVQILNETLEGHISHTGYPTGNAFNGKIENGNLVVSWEKDRWINLKLRKDGREIKLVGESAPRRCMKDEG
jgi:hypothetical protein